MRLTAAVQFPASWNAKQWVTQHDKLEHVNQPLPVLFCTPCSFQLTNQADNPCLLIAAHVVSRNTAMMVFVALGISAPVCKLLFSESGVLFSENGVVRIVPAHQVSPVACVLALVEL